jgi:hypothetical protein
VGANLTAVHRITEHEPHSTLLSSQHFHRRGLVVQESHDDVSLQIAASIPNPHRTQRVRPADEGADRMSEDRMKPPARNKGRALGGGAKALTAAVPPPTAELTSEQYAAEEAAACPRLSSA